MRKLITKNLYIITTIYSFLLLLFTVLCFYSPLATISPPMNDNAWYQWSGWNFANGLLPYVDLWETKFPLIGIEFTTLVSTVFGDNIYLTHLFYLIFMVLVYFSLIFSVIWLSWILTKDKLSANLAGLSLLTFPIFSRFTVFGIRPKIVMMLLAILGIITMVKKKFFWSGILSGLAGGCWQIGLLFPAITFIESLLEENRKHFWKAISGITIAFGIVFIPLIIWDVFDEMITMTILFPLVVNEQTGGANPLKILSGISLMVIFFTVGYLQVTYRTYKSPRKFWWLTLGITVFIVQVLFLDYDGYGDLIPLVVFCSLGLGIGFQLLEREKTISILLLILILILIPWFYTPFLGLNQGLNFSYIRASIQKGYLQFGPTLNQKSKVEKIDGEVFPLEPLSASGLYWHKFIPSNCDIRKSKGQKKWLETMGHSTENKQCGKLPKWRKLKKILF